MNKMLINKLYIINFSLNKVFIRGINNAYLKKALGDLTELNVNKFKLDKDINIALEKINNIEIQQSIKQEPLIYEDILKNLEESENLLNKVKDNLNIAKENSFNITLKVEDINNTVKNDKIINLNNKKNYYKDDNLNLELNKQDNLSLDTNNDNIQNSIYTVKKGIFDVEWLKPFIDFIHNHSSLVLTIGGGLIMGGMWYMNNVGYINIGSMLTRLGIKIFSNNSNISNNNIELPSIQSIEVENRLNVLENQVGHGFFRQLGVKLLEILDVYIEKIKNKKQSYK